MKPATYDSVPNTWVKNPSDVDLGQEPQREEFDVRHGRCQACRSAGKEKRPRVGDRPQADSINLGFRARGCIARSKFAKSVRCSFLKIWDQNLGKLHRNHLSCVGVRTEAFERPGFLRSAGQPMRVENEIDEMAYGNIKAFLFWLSTMKQPHTASDRTAGSAQEAAFPSRRSHLL